MPYFLFCEQEVELLTLYKAIVDSGPDLFSLHRVDLEAPFRYAMEYPLMIRILNG